nr:MAG TPA: hypothetical protein [Caudoviricetes sp.]
MARCGYAGFGTAGVACQVALWLDMEVFGTAGKACLVEFRHGSAWQGRRG